MRRLASSLGLGLALVFATTLAASAEAAVWRGFSINALGYGPQDSLKQLDSAKDGGANIVRIDIAWADLQPVDKDHYDATYRQQIDDYLQQAADRGLKVIAIVQSTPCWASSAPGKDCNGDWHSAGVTTYPPSDVSDYARAAAWIAQRWSAKLAAIEIWNEPNNADFWHSDHWDTDYAALLKAAYPAVKAVAPGLIVLGGSLLFSHADSLDDLYDDGIKGFFDAISIHPYDDPTRPDATHTFSQGVPLVHQAMVAHGDGDKRVWLTEFGWPTCASNVFAWCVSEEEQATKLSDAFDTAAGWPYVDALIIFGLRDGGTDASDWQSDMGLLHYDFTPKPAWTAFQHAVAPANAPPPPPPSALAATSATAPANSAPPVGPSSGPRRGHVAPLPTLRRWTLLRARALRVYLICRARERCRGVIRIVRRRGRRTITLAALQVSLPAGRESVRAVRLSGAVAARVIRLLVGR